MKFYSRFILFLMLAAFLFVSCEDDPSSLGSDLIGDDFIEDIIVLKETEITGLSSVTSFSGSDEDSITYGANDRLFLGNVNGIRSDLLLRFDIAVPDSVTDAIEDGELNIISSQINMWPNFNLGDREASFDFSAHLVNEKWGTADFGPDSLAALNYGSANIAENIDYQDSVLYFDIDQAIVKDWFLDYSDTSEVINNGILLSPLSDQRVLGFYAVDETNRTLAIELKTIYNINDAEPDTLLHYVGWDIHVLNFERDEPVVSDELTLIQGGYNLRTNLDIQLEDLPTTLAINQAILEIKMDSLSSIYDSKAIDSLSVYPYSDSTLTELIALKGTLSRDPERKDVFRGDISNLLQYLISNDENHGLRISVEDEFMTLSRYALFNEKAASADRPKLIIYYTSKN